MDKRGMVEACTLESRMPRVRHACSGSSTCGIVAWDSSSQFPHSGRERVVPFLLWYTTCLFFSSLSFPPCCASFFVGFLFCPLLSLLFSANVSRAAILAVVYLRGGTNFANQHSTSLPYPHFPSLTSSLLYLLWYTLNDVIAGISGTPSLGPSSHSCLSLHFGVLRAGTRRLSLVVNNLRPEHHDTRRCAPGDPHRRWIREPLTTGSLPPSPSLAVFFPLWPRRPC